MGERGVKDYVANLENNRKRNRAFAALLAIRAPLKVFEETGIRKQIRRYSGHPDFKKLASELDLKLEKLKKEEEIEMMKKKIMAAEQELEQMSASKQEGKSLEKPVDKDEKKPKEAGPISKTHFAAPTQTIPKLQPKLQSSNADTIAVESQFERKKSFARHAEVKKTIETSSRICQELKNFLQTESNRLQNESNEKCVAKKNLYLSLIHLSDAKLEEAIAANQELSTKVDHLYKIELETIFGKEKITSKPHHLTWKQFMEGLIADRKKEEEERLINLSKKIKKNHEAIKTDTTKTKFIPLPESAKRKRKADASSTKPAKKPKKESTALWKKTVAMYKKEVRYMYKRRV